MKPEVLAVIPARGGSKGIPRKNLVDVKGMPLVAHSILHGLAAKSVSRVVVSSEDDEILETAKKYGAEALERPVELAGDEVLDYPVFRHCLETLAKASGYRPQYIVHLRPTAPYRKTEWIDAAVAALQTSEEADSIRSVSEPAAHPYRIFRIDGNGFLDPIMAHEHLEPFLLRRQELPPMYYYNCVLDVSKYSTIMEKESMTGTRLLPFIMNPEEALDIDTPRDLEFVRYFMREMA